MRISCERYRARLPASVPSIEDQADTLADGAFPVLGERVTNLPVQMRCYTGILLGRTKDCISDAVRIHAETLDPQSLRPT